MEEYCDSLFVIISIALLFIQCKQSINYSELEEKEGIVYYNGTAFSGTVNKL